MSSPIVVWISESGRNFPWVVIDPASRVNSPRGSRILPLWSNAHRDGLSVLINIQTRLKPIEVYKCPLDGCERVRIDPIGFQHNLPLLVSDDSIPSDGKQGKKVDSKCPPLKSVGFIPLGAIIAYFFAWNIYVNCNSAWRSGLFFCGLLGGLGVFAYGINGCLVCSEEILNETSKSESIRTAHLLKSEGGSADFGGLAFRSSRGIGGAFITLRTSALNRLHSGGSFALSSFFSFVGESSMFLPLVCRRNQGMRKPGTIVQPTSAHHQ